MRKIAILFLICAIAFAPMLYAAAGYEDGDTGTLGNNQWRVRTDGDLEPNVDSTYDIGQSGNEVAAIYVDNIYSGGGGKLVMDQINVAPVEDGTAAAYYVNMTPGISAYATGTMVIFRAKTANSGALTLNVNGLGAKSVKKLNDQNPASSHIEAGQMVMAIFDYSDDVWEIIQPDANP